MIPSTLSEYWRAVAQAINAENRKASLFLKDKHSRGIAREAILRFSIATHTPEPFKVETGFICNIPSNAASGKAPELWYSSQCDVLVYDPHVARPYYSFDKLAVVSPCAARAVVEVKTDLKGSTLKEILGVWEHIRRVRIPMFGFAFSGCSFGTFLDKLAAEIRTNPAGVPECIAVHRKNYLFVRSAYRLAPRPDKPNHHRPAQYQLAVNFGAGKDQEGIASACFFETYQHWLANTGNESLLLDWFNSLELPKEAKVRIDDGGEVTQGQLTAG
jgi:hypothetical protein